MYYFKLKVFIKYFFLLFLFKENFQKNKTINFIH